MYLKAHKILHKRSLSQLDVLYTLKNSHVFIHEAIITITRDSTTSSINNDLWAHIKEMCSFFRIAYIIVYIIEVNNSRILKWFCPYIKLVHILYVQSSFWSWKTYILGGSNKLSRMHIAPTLIEEHSPFPPLCKVN